MAITLDSAGFGLSAGHSGICDTSFMHDSVQVMIWEVSLLSFLLVSFVASRRDGRPMVYACEANEAFIKRYLETHPSASMQRLAALSF